jgi:hypothetical protein
VDGGKSNRIQCVNGALASLTMPATEDGLPVLAGLVGAQALLGRPVDLVELGAVRNPYLRQGNEASPQLLYTG